MFVMTRASAAGSASVSASTPACHRRALLALMHCFGKTRITPTQPPTKCMLLASSGMQLLG